MKAKIIALWQTLKPYLTPKIKPVVTGKTYANRARLYATAKEQK